MATTFLSTFRLAVRYYAELQSLKAQVATADEPVRLAGEVAATVAAFHTAVAQAAQLAVTVDADRLVTAIIRSGESRHSLA